MESIQETDEKPPEMTQLEKMKQELDKMDAEDKRKEDIAKEKHRLNVKRERKLIEEERIAKGIAFDQDIRQVKGAVRGITEKERQLALQSKIDQMDKESEHIQEKIDHKYGVLFSKDKEKPNLTELADNFFNLPGNIDLPRRITQALTSEEISDLKIVFDMFDVKGKGYITADDLKRVVKMLGFRAPKKVFNGMIADVASEGSKEEVTLVNFLDIVVRSQGAGNDPYIELKQAFDLLDIHNNGYLTLEDIRDASDECKVHLSNRMIREMIQEADKSGDGKITCDEFVNIMLQTSSFKLFR